VAFAAGPGRAGKRDDLTERHPRMSLSQVKPKTSASYDLARLFFGGTFLGYVFLALDVQLSLTIPAENYVTIPVKLLPLTLATGAFVEPFLQLRKRSAAAAAGAVGLGLAGFLVYSLAAFALTSPAPGGISGSGWFGIGYFNAGTYVMIAVFWLLAGVPHRAFKIKLDPDGEEHAQRFLLRLISTAAAILTGIYILLLYFGGPLRGIDAGQLAAGIILAMFLIAPIYMSLAKACWQHGIRDVVSLRPLRNTWGKILAELGEAFYPAARHDLASRNEPAPGSQEDSPGRQRAGDQHPGSSPGPGKAP
jgi:hypothetical protein